MARGGGATAGTLSMTLTMLLTAAHLTASEYHLIQRSATWQEAQSYCRVKHADLATVHHMDDQRRLLRTLTPPGLSSWIGLQRGHTLRWQWSDGSGPAHFTMWREGEPNNVAGNEWCAETSPEGRWNDVPCEEEKGFVCLERRQDGQHRFVYHAHHQSFHTAQDQCRAAHRDLATVSSHADNHDIAKMLQPDTKAWIGLFRGVFLWSSRAQSSFRFWQRGPRDGEGCTYARASDPGHWVEASCAEKKTFVCEGGLKVRTVVVGVALRTHAGVPEPALSADLLEKLEAALRATYATDFRLTWRRYDSGSVFQQQKQDQGQD